MSRRNSGYFVSHPVKLIQEKVPICVENCDARGLEKLRDQYEDKKLWWEDDYTRHGFFWWAFHDAFVSACLKKVDAYVQQNDYAGFKKFSDSFESDIMTGDGMEELKEKMKSAREYLGEIGRKEKLVAEEKRKKEEAATELAKDKAENEERVNWMIEYIFGKGKTSNLPMFCGFQLGGSRYVYPGSRVVGWSGQLEKPFRHFREYHVSENNGIVYHIELKLDNDDFSVDKVDNSRGGTQRVTGHHVSDTTFEEEMKIVASLLEKKFGGKFSEWRDNAGGRIFFRQGNMIEVGVSTERVMKACGCEVTIVRGSVFFNRIVEICVDGQGLKDKIRKAREAWDTEQDKKKGVVLDAKVGADVL